MASPAWQGYAEADYVKAAPVEQGMLTTISVSRGDRISKGAPLFAQDDTHERAARDQAARQLAQAEEQLANLEAASKPTEVTQAQANLTDAARRPSMGFAPKSGFAPDSPLEEAVPGAPSRLGSTALAAEPSRGSEGPEVDYDGLLGPVPLGGDRGFESPSLLRRVSFDPSRSTRARI